MLSYKAALLILDGTMIVIMLIMSPIVFELIEAYRDMLKGE